MSHPDPELLRLHAAEGGIADIERHVQTCDSCRGELAEIQESLQLVRESSSTTRRVPRADCLDELVIARFVENKLSATERETSATHMATCAHCRAVLRAAAGSVAESAVPIGKLFGRRWTVSALAAAAAIATIALWPRDSAPPGISHRDTAVTLAETPSPIAPRAVVVRPDRLTWSSVPGAARYRARLFDSAGGLLWEAETEDTSVALPDSVAFVQGVPYLWNVGAETQAGRWVLSPLTSFTVTPTRR